MEIARPPRAAGTAAELAPVAPAKPRPAAYENATSTARVAMKVDMALSALATSVALVPPILPATTAPLAAGAAAARVPWLSLGWECVVGVRKLLPGDTSADPMFGSWVEAGGASTWLLAAT